MSHVADHEPTIGITVEQAARQRQEAAEDLDRVLAEVASLKPAYEAAAKRASEARNHLRRIDAAMAGVAAAARVRAALSEKGLQYEGPAILSWEVIGRIEFAPLAAVGPEGTGLYIDVPEKSHRYLGKSHLILVEHLGRHASETGALVRGEGAMRRAVWEERGSGAWGAGTGSMKPKAPPEGGRWKWLKVKDGKELTA